MRSYNQEDLHLNVKESYEIGPSSLTNEFHIHFKPNSLFRVHDDIFEFLVEKFLS